MSLNLDTQVIIAGGGPVGMTTALFLAHYGIRSILLEQNPTTTRHPKMDLTNGRAMELFRKLGLVEKLREVGVPPENPFDITWFTTLGGHELYRFKYPSSAEKAEIIAKENDGSHAREAGMRVSQIIIEPVLKDQIDAEPLVDVRFSNAFERIVEQTDEGITIEALDKTTNTKTTLTGLYLLGCDGGRSKVRQELGIDLDGEMAAAAAYMVHFRSQARDVLQRGGISWHLQTGSGTIICQDDDEIWTLQRWLAPDDDPSTMEPSALLQEWAGCTFDHEVLQANPWTANFVVAQKYTSGRTLLAGDSAHQFMPTGGYGMNSGIADAAGVAWMLTALIEGWGGEKLIEAYDAERRPTAWFHLAASRRHLGVRIQIAELYGEAMAKGDLDGTGPEAEALRAETAAGLEALGNAENESWGVEWGYRYDESPITIKDGTPSEVDPLIYRPNTWPGARLPHIFLEDGVSVHDQLGKFFTLLVVGDADVSAFERTSASMKIPLEVLKLNRPDLKAVFERELVLVRPDQHVAWRGDTVPADCASILKSVVGH